MVGLHRVLLLSVGSALVGCVHVPRRPAVHRVAESSSAVSFDAVASQQVSSSPVSSSAASASALSSPALCAATQNPNARKQGSDALTSQVFYGIPILQKSFYWDGNGEVDNSGFGVHWLHYVADGVAIGPGLNAATWWTPGRDVYSVELEALLRIHPFDDIPVFIDGSAGYQLANDQIPPGGTVWNFSFGFGFGTEVPISDRTWFQAGAFYHHISNALGPQNDRNPSQNEARIWVGFAVDL